MAHRYDVPAPEIGTHAWALVLGAGEGKRLRSLTTTASGVTVPKQFCSLAGGGSLLAEALHRSAVVAAPERISVVVASEHERWWRPLLGSISQANVIVQPRNCGTAIGILLPLLSIARRDPQATLLVLPSDHFVRHEEILAQAMREALRQAHLAPDGIILLGIDPEEADPELGYILPHSAFADDACQVHSFVEKPDSDTARRAIDAGGLWNSFIFAATARSLLALFEHAMPEVVMELAEMSHRIASGRASIADLAVLYERLPTVDFSRDVMQRFPQRLRVVRVPRCGWSDLGTPRRVAQVLHRERPVARAHGGGHAGFLDLAVQHAEYRLIG